MKGQIALVSGMLAVGASTWATADTFQLTPIKDNTLYENPLGGLSSGIGESILVGRSGPLGGQLIKRGVLAFDVAGNVPANSVVCNVTLTLDLVAGSMFGAPTQTISLHRLLNDWGEGQSFAVGGAGAPAEPGDATWLHTFYSVSFWTTAGGDFDVTVSDSQIVTSVPGLVTWGSTPTMVAEVQDWLDNPGTNYGWLIQGNEIDDFTGRRFASREALLAVAPVLTIEIVSVCPWDCDGTADSEVSTADLLALLAQWGTPDTCDFDGSGAVGTADLLKLLANWGPCD